MSRRFHLLWARALSFWVNRVRVPIARKIGWKLANRLDDLNYITKNSILVLVMFGLLRGWSREAAILGILAAIVAQNALTWNYYTWLRYLDVKAAENAPGTAAGPG